MNVLIVTVGTRGDVQPYVALGKGLMAAGHDVTLCTCAYFESFVATHGLGFAPIGNELIEFMRSEDGKIAMENTGNLWEAIRTAWRLLPKVGPMQRRQVNDIWDAARKIEPELILFHPKAIGIADFAAKLGIPCMLAFYLPMFVPTGEFPAMGFPELRLGRWYNRLTYRFIEKATWLATGKIVNEWRRSEGLKRRGGGRYLRQPDGTPISAMHAFSESVLPRPADWPDNATVTGYWFLDESKDWHPPERLVEFLGPGEPPVYIGFGSIFGRDPQRLTRLVVKAVEAAGVRAILASGWGGLAASESRLPNTILEVDAVPHDWLFPRVAAVVHHGGCGTTAAGLRAGRPTIICPFFGDQPFWGARVAGLGIGPRPIRQKRLTVEGLADAIREATRNDEMREKAEAIGCRIRTEDGVARAVEFVDSWLRSLE